MWLIKYKLNANGLIRCYRCVCGVCVCVCVCGGGGGGGVENFHNSPFLDKRLWKWALILTGINFNPKMDKLSQPLCYVGWNNLSIPKRQRCSCQLTFQTLLWHENVTRFTWTAEIFCKVPGFHRCKIIEESPCLFLRYLVTNYKWNNEKISIISH